MTEVYENFISKMFADMKIETAKELALLYLGLRLGKDLEYCVTGYTGSGGKKSTIELGYFDSDILKQFLMMRLRITRLRVFFCVRWLRRIKILKIYKFQNWRRHEDLQRSFSIFNK